jgi:hypothetical protein
LWKRNSNLKAKQADPGCISKMRPAKERGRAITPAPFFLAANLVYRLTIGGATS